MDPASIGDLHKLREAIRHSQNELEPFRQQYRERLVQYAGVVSRMMRVHLTTTNHSNYTNGMS
jgi:hypothetical protein